MSFPHDTNVRAKWAVCRPFFELDESEQDDEQRRLAGTRAPDNTNLLARVDLKADFAQHEGHLRAVAERDVLEAHHALLGPFASGYAALAAFWEQKKIHRNRPFRSAIKAEARDKACAFLGDE